MAFTKEEAQSLITAAYDDAKRWVAKKIGPIPQHHIVHIVDPLEFDDNVTKKHYYGLAVAFVSEDAQEVLQASQNIHAQFGLKR